MLAGIPIIADRGLPSRFGVAARPTRAGLQAANANDATASEANAQERRTPAVLVEAGAYRLPGLYEGRGLSWQAVSGALTLHALVLLAVVSLAWTGRPPIPLQTTIAVVFERPAPALQAPPVVAAPVPPQAVPPEPVQPQPREPEPTAASVPSPPMPAPPRPVQDAMPAPSPQAATVALPLPPPPRPVIRRAAVEPAPRPARALAPAQVPAPRAAAAVPAPAATSAPASAASAAVAQATVVPVIPPRPASGVAGNRKPVYPLVARSRHMEGRVVLQVQVSVAGDPLSVRVISSSGHSLLDESALAAVRTWHFIPATRAGQAVAGSVDVPVDFRMAD